MVATGDGRGEADGVEDDDDDDVDLCVEDATPNAIGDAALAKDDAGFVAQLAEEWAGEELAKDAADAALLVNEAELETTEAVEETGLAMTEEAAFRKSDAFGDCP